MTESIVYFLRALSGGPVKIGVTRNLEARLNQFATGRHEPLECIRRIPGRFALERYFHDLFSEHHISGEWFEYHPDMMIALPDEMPEEIQGPDREAHLWDNETYAELVAGALRRAMGNLRYTEMQVAKKIGCSARTVENWLNGKGSPRGDQLLNLIAHFPQVAAAVLQPPMRQNLATLRRAMGMLEVAERELTKSLEELAAQDPAGAPQ